MPSELDESVPGLVDEIVARRRAEVEARVVLGLVDRHGFGILQRREPRGRWTLRGELRVLVVGDAVLVVQCRQLRPELVDVGRVRGDLRDERVRLSGQVVEPRLELVTRVPVGVLPLLVEDPDELGGERIGELLRPVGGGLGRSDGDGRGAAVGRRDDVLGELAAALVCCPTSSATASGTSPVVVKMATWSRLWNALCVCPLRWEKSTTNVVVAL